MTAFDPISHLTEGTDIYTHRDAFVLEVVISACASEGSSSLDVYRTLGHEAQALAETALAHAEEKFFVPRSGWSPYGTGVLSALQNSYRMTLYVRRPER